MVLFDGKIRVTVEKIRLACNLRGNVIVGASSERIGGNDHEPMDETTNRTLPGTLREISPQIDTDLLRITAFLFEVIEN